MSYAELHCVTNYSFLRGASQPEELVREAAARGYRALAITDECSLAGVVKAHMAARECGLRLIIGSEFRLEPEYDEDEHGLKLVLLAPDRAAYGQLAALITLGRRRSPKGEYSLRLADFEHLVPACLALWIPDHRRDRHLNQRDGERLVQVFGTQSDARLWLALELFQESDDVDRVAELINLSIRLDLPIVASGDVHMHVPTRKALQDVVTAIRHRTTVAQAGLALHPNRERHLRPLETLRRIYPPEALAESVRIAGRCGFSLDELRYEYPEELVPAGRTASEYLAELTWAGAARRWPGGIPEATRALVGRELTLIAELAYEHYFLTVHDVVHFARSRGILCQGRGSAANSAVCYCLHITEVDPSRMSVLFERFISKERNEPPDIDVDFEHERREEVIQYIYKRYGRDRAALAAALVTYRPRSAVRDVGKALGMDADLVDQLARSLSWWDDRDALNARLTAAGLDPAGELARQFLVLVHALLGFPRHLSQHTGGFVISAGPVSALVPVENAAMPERTIIQWDKDDLESLGLLKIDVLALGMLTAIRKALVLVAARRGEPMTLAHVPPEDPETYEMLCRGESTGVFQVESRAQMSMLPRLQPRCFYDLVIEVAIVRPGPIQGDMVHPYLRRRQGEEPVSYPSEAVRGVLERTLGVPIFQEQVIKLAMVAAGFSAGEADQLRRAMAAWRRKGGLDAFERKLVEGMLARGHDEQFAECVFRQIKGFGEYGFPESHAASFALLVYVSAWLKRHEPAAFYCALLNSQPMGFYSPSQLVQDARRQGIEFLPVDINISRDDHTLVVEAPGSREWPAVRLGLRLVKGLSAAAIARIEATRPAAGWCDVDALARAANLDQGDLGALARAGALAGLAGHRHRAQWTALGVQAPAPLWRERGDGIADEAPADMPPPGPGADMLADYSSIGLTLGPHPLTLLREHFSGCVTAAALDDVRHGRIVRVAGIITGRQRPASASGVLFLTLEDDTGNVNVVVWTRVLERFRSEILGGTLIEVHGVLEREARVVHVVAGRVLDRSELVHTLPSVSRDFR